MTTSDNGWQQGVQRVVQQEAKSDNEWKRVTANDERQRVVILANFPFLSNKRGTYHYAP